MAMSSLRAGAFRLARGTALSQVVVVLATPILTRSYSPRDFGQLAFIVSLYTILVGVSTLKLEMSILLPKERSKALLLTLSSLIMSAAGCLILLIAITFVVLGSRTLSWQFCLLPVAIFSGALLSLGQQWCAREKVFGAIGNSLLVSSFVNVTLAGLLYMFGVPSGGLVIGFTIGLMAAASYTILRQRDAFGSIAAAITDFRPSMLWQLLQEYRNLPLHVLPNSILVSLSYTLLPLLIARFFDTDAIGLYSVANRFLVLPTILIGGAVSDVFRSEFVSRLHQNSDYKGLFRKVFRLLVLLSVPMFTFMWLVSPFVFDIVFGSGFSQAGIFAQYLCLGVAGNLFVQVFSYIFIALAKTRTSLMLQLVVSVGPLLGFAIGALQHDMRIALGTMSLVTFCASVLFVFVAFRSVKHHMPPPEVAALSVSL